MYKQYLKAPDIRARLERVPWDAKKHPRVWRRLAHLPQYDASCVNGRAVRAELHALDRLSREAEETYVSVKTGECKVGLVTGRVALLVHDVRVLITMLPRIFDCRVYDSQMLSAAWHVAQKHLTQRKESVRLHHATRLNAELPAVCRQTQIRRYSRLPRQC